MKSNDDIIYARMPSPIGRLTLTGDGRALTSIFFDRDDRLAGGPPTGWREDARALRDARAQLEEYFAGKRVAFDLPLALRGTPFQMSVWQALLRIPYGVTASYGEIAAAIGRPGASRAVGGANHNNPIPIVVPCHRVIGSDGSLTGYGGGEDRKRRLLALEGGGGKQTQLALVS